MTAALLALVPALGPAPSAAPPDHMPADDVLARAERAFDEGVRHRHDAAAARAWFRAAAIGYDELWRRGHRNPALALDRARAHRLAGDLPGAVVALHDGLAAARYDRPLQAALEDARSAVAYPHDGELAAQCRPRPRVTVGARMSPAEAFIAAGLLWLLAGLGAARFAMTRNPSWLLTAGAGLAVLAVLGGLWWQDWRHRERDEGKPLVVVKDDVLLRKGNGESYPPRLESRLPRGVEARELTRRGGWVQVELAGGAVGWLPEAAVLRSAESRAE
jgi:hypothetical protein